MSPPADLSVLRAATDAPERLGLVSDGLQATWRQLGELVRVELAALRRDGSGRGSDPIAVRGHARRESILRLLAAFESGAPAVLLHPRWTPAETTAALELARAGLRALERPASPSSQAGPGDPLAVAFTSGSTGAPRGVVLTRGALLAAAAASAAHLGWQDGDRWLLCLSTAHVGGLSILTRCLAARKTIVLLPRFDPAAMIEAIERHRVTLASLVPSMLARTLEEAPSWTPPARLRAVLLGGAAAPRPLLDEARRRGIPLLATYGLTEACSQVTTQQPGQAPSSEAGCGRPLPGMELELVEGRIRVRGPAVARVALTAAGPEPLLDAEGWLETGDLGRLDERGRLHVAGRSDEQIVTGGENVSPLEVERALERAACVHAALVFAVPDPVYGERVAAALVPAGPHPRNHAALLDCVRRRLAPFKRPRLIVWVERLPQTRSGKPDRRGAAAALAGRLQPLD